MLEFIRCRLRAGFLLLLLMLPAVVRADTPAHSVSPAHQVALQRHRSQYAEALLAGDATRLAVASSDELRLMTESQPTVFGPANVAAYYRAYLARFTVSAYAREAAGQIDLGARIVEFGRFSERLVKKSDGRTFELNGKYLDAWEKNADGDLRLVVTAWNYDAWLPDADAWRFPEVPAVRTAFQARAPINSEVSFELAAWGRLMEAAIIQHDAALWSRCYADDAVLLANNEGLHVGRQAVDAYIAAHAPELPVFEKLDLRNDRIEELGDYVLEYASHVANWRNGSASGVSTGKNLRLWRRDPNHALKIVVQIGAYD